MAEYTTTTSNNLKAHSSGPLYMTNYYKVKDYLFFYIKSHIEININV